MRRKVSKRYIGRVQKGPVYPRPQRFSLAHPETVKCSCFGAPCTGSGTPCWSTSVLADLGAGYYRAVGWVPGVYYPVYYQQGGQRFS